MIGATGMDYLVQAPSLARLGETVLAESHVRMPGGTAANQAIAAARMGAPVVRLVADLGDDEDGAEVLRYLRAEGLDTSAVEIVAHALTGLSIICQVPQGGQSILVVPGANAALGADRVARLVSQAEGEPQILVLQGDARSDLAAAAVRSAGPADRIVAVMSEWGSLPQDALLKADPMILEYTTAEAVLGRVIDGPVAAVECARELNSLARSVVLQVGPACAAWSAAGEAAHVQSTSGGQLRSDAISADAFTGALAADLAIGAPLDAAVRTATQASTFAASTVGRAGSFPTRAQLELSAALPG